MITSLCETSHVVIFYVSHDVPSVFFNYIDVMLNVPETCTYWNNDIPIFIKATK
jgi:hypothetical protein